MVAVKQADEDSILESLAKMQAINDARRTISLAKTRCLPWSALLERLRECRGEDSELVYVVIESSRTSEEDCALTETLREILESTESPGPDRDRVERGVARMLRIVRPDISKALAMECLQHRRKSRRTIGFRAAANFEIDSDLTRFCLIRFSETSDDRFLKLLLNKPLHLEQVDPHQLIKEFADDEYWKMRVIESTLRADKQVGLRLSNSFPKPFIWAAGRLGLSGFIPEIKSLLASSNEAHLLLGIVAWAFGRFGVLSELEDLSRLVDNIAQTMATSELPST
jgi:hypothetical protein